MKIYLNDNEVEYYRRLGIPVHEGPRGGRFIYSEDLKGIGEKFRNQLDEKTLISEVSSLVKTFGGDVKRVWRDGSRVYVSLSEDMWYIEGIFFDKDAIGIFYKDKKYGDVHGWTVEFGSNPAKFVVASRILKKAFDALNNEDVMNDYIETIKEKTHGILNGVLGIAAREGFFDRLIGSVVIVSIALGLNFVDAEYYDIENGSDLFNMINLVFGPWVADNVFVVCEDCDVEIDDIGNVDFWRSLGQIVAFVYGNNFGQLKFRFVDIEDIKKEAGWNTYAYYSSGKIVLPVNGPSLEKYNFIGVLWHEFQHYLYYKLGMDISGVEYRAYKLALQGKFTEYAKTNGNEALSEFFALLATGKLSLDDDEVRELYDSYLRAIRLWL